MPAAWTPATLASTLPRADRRELGAQRIYFYDVETRAEISDHPLAGMIWTGTGPMVSHEGRYVDGTSSAVHGVAYFDGQPRRVTVDAASFPGRRVAAKVWYGPSAGDRSPEWRLLAAGDESAVVGKQERISARDWLRLYV